MLSQAIKSTTATPDMNKEMKNDSLSHAPGGDSLPTRTVADTW